MAIFTQDDDPKLYQLVEDHALAMADLLGEYIVKHSLDVNVSTNAATKASAMVAGNIYNELNNVGAKIKATDIGSVLTYSFVMTLKRTMDGDYPMSIKFATIN